MLSPGVDLHGFRVASDDDGKYLAVDVDLFALDEEEDDGDDNEE